METLIRDVKQAFRMLGRSKGFAATAIAALTLGIGANTAIFSVVYQVLLKPLPYPEVERIVVLQTRTPEGNFASASAPKYNVWRNQGTALEDVAAYDTGGPGINLSGGEKPEQVKGIHVSHEFFRLFGAGVELGRTFTKEEDRPRGGNVLVMGYGLWQRRYGGDRGIVGKALSLGGEPYTVIGVVSRRFTFEPEADLYLPLQADPESAQQAHYFRVAARLKAGISEAEANAAMGLAAAEFRRRFPNALGPQETFGVARLQGMMVRDVKRALLVLLGAVGFVLLIACANVASLMVARASVRTREIALRVALGAGRGRIVRQLLTESVLLAAIGGLLGLGVGMAGVRGLLALNPGDLPRIGPGGAAVTLEWTALVFTMGLAVVTGVLFGLAPAVQASRTDVNMVLKESGGRTGTGLRQNRARSLLVVVEMALAMVLLIGAGLLMRTFAALQSVAPGFDARNVLAMETSLTGSKWDKTEAIADLVRQAVERMEGLAGVQAAAASCYVPLEGGLGLPFVVEGRPLTDGPAHGGAGWAYVTPHFFDVFKVGVVKGRVFEERDRAGAPGVVMINEAFARKYWPKEEALGQRLSIGKGVGPAFEEGAREVVGIVADARDAGLNQDPVPQMFVPLAQVKDAVMAMNNRFLPLTWVARTSGGPMTVASGVQRVFQDLADLPVARVRTMEQVVARSTASTRFHALLLGIFAATAILLASIGLYGLMAYTVQQRTVEFGIRLALGADQGVVRKMVVGQAMTLAGVGIGVGLVAAFGLTRLMKSMLFEVKATDPVVFGGVAVLLGGIALLASWIPARRAVGVDPVTALRYE